MREFLRKHHISFQSATNGVVWSLKTQPNFRIHLFLSALALCFAYYFDITRFEWMVIVFTIIMGLIAEMINTAIEAMTDLITTEWRQQAKIAKDVSAGMMLTVAIGAVVIALIIFWPYFFQ